MPGSLLWYGYSLLNQVSITFLLDPYYPLKTYYTISNLYNFSWMLKKLERNDTAPRQLNYTSE
ncbi:MAG TPA: hypothetical protein DCP28_20820 [Cytophagales bacterium]|nr:hypothetical protein [Cytophagales bacterium]